MAWVQRTAAVRMFDAEFHHAQGRLLRIADVHVRPIALFMALSLGGYETDGVGHLDSAIYGQDVGHQSAALPLALWPQA